MRNLPDAVVRYAAHDDGLVDVHLPTDRSGSPARLLVLVHGGFWKQAYDRTHTRPLAAALAREGFVVATPEYRRVGGGGGWPATLEDADRAMAAIPALVEGLGAVALQPGGVTVLGHSAGGHLALWLANQPHPVDRVVGLAPVADLRVAARTGLGSRAPQALLGGEPEEVPQRYDAADPMTRFATRPPCEVVVVHGADDENVPVSVSEGFATRHGFVDLRVLPDTEHFAVIDPQSAAWPHVLAAVTP